MEAELLGPPGFPIRGPGCQMGAGRTLDRKASWDKCHGGMCIFVPDTCHYFFPPILGQKLAFCLWALEVAVSRGNTPARHGGPGDGSHVAMHQWYHPPWQLAPQSPAQTRSLKGVTQTWKQNWQFKSTLKDGSGKLAPISHLQASALGVLLHGGNGWPALPGRAESAPHTP